MAGVAEMVASVVANDLADRSKVSQAESSIDQVRTNETMSDHEESGSEVRSNSHTETPPSTTANGRDVVRSEKRARKKVQRLSETWSQAHVEQVEQKAKVAKELFSVLETGSGTPLGDIPNIEAAFRKSKPIDLKGLHAIIYGRPGAATEIRSNLRKFRGFGFKRGSEAYDKKITQMQNRSTSELREALRILNLEVSGTRDQLVLRLLEFLLLPSSKMVKYKGKLPPKSHRGRPKSVSSGKKKRTSQGSKAGSTKAPSSEVSGDCTSRSGIEYDEEGASISDEDGSSPSEAKSDQDDDDQEKSPKKPIKKRGRPPGKSSRPTPTTKPKRKRTVVSTDSESEEDTVDKLDPKCGSSIAAAAESDEDMPLSALAPPKPGVVPSDAELKRSIIDLLKTVNLEETSLKLVREQIFSRYPGVDLSNKKDFINTTVKEYLARS